VTKGIIVIGIDMSGMNGGMPIMLMFMFMLLMFKPMLIAMLFSARFISLCDIAALLSTRSGLGGGVYSRESALSVPDKRRGGVAGGELLRAGEGAGEKDGEEASDVEGDDLAFTRTVDCSTKGFEIRWRFGADQTIIS